MYREGIGSVRGYCELASFAIRPPAPDGSVRPKDESVDRVGRGEDAQRPDRAAAAGVGKVPDPSPGIKVPQGQGPVVMTGDRGARGSAADRRDSNDRGRVIGQLEGGGGVDAQVGIGPCGAVQRVKGRLWPPPG